MLVLPRCLVVAVLVSLSGPVAHLRAEEKPLRQFIDGELQAAWQREKITPVGRSDDATFLRRIYLDLVGSIPTLDETRKFLDDTDAQKRDKLIDRLLADPRHAEHQANVWDYVLFGRNPSGGDATRKRDGFKKWLAGKFAQNEPYDRWVRELLLADQEGSELFYVQFRNQPEDATVAVTRIFLGTQLQCARCHDHPFDSWTQKDFYGMAGFFVRLVVLDAGGRTKFKIGEKSSGEVLFTGAVKDQKPGQKGEPIKPKFLGGNPLDEPPLPAGFKEPDSKNPKSLPKPPFSRKEKLAEWLIGPDNPYFARAVANRVWAQFMGRGFVHPVDDLSAKNQPSHPELLQAMSDGFKAHQFDLKWLIREIVHSEAYQLAATGPMTAAQPQWYERVRVRPLSAEELIAAFRVVTSQSESKTPLPNAAEDYIMRFFGEPTNGQGEFQGSLSEHLFLNNSTQLRQLIQPRKGNLADTLLGLKVPADQRVERLFLAVLNRPPKPTEQKRFVAFLRSSGKTDTLMEEAIWVLLNTAEFRFNH